MTALLGILWFIGLIINILAIKEFGRMEAMVSMFPEGRRWWILPGFLVTLVTFAALVRYNPF